MRIQRLLCTVALIAVFAQGCASPPTMKRIKGYTKHTKVDGHWEKEKVAPQPGYYAVLPFAVLYDAVTGPFLFVYAVVGVNSGLIKP